nr:rhomboid family intramembrane serine protease [uncultured Moellerella sp.]
MKTAPLKIWLKQRFLFLSLLTIFLIFIQLINSLIGITQWGILPRTSEGLIGIFFAPFIHGSWGHLFSNLPPLLILSALLLSQSLKQYIYASLFIIVVGGLMVWIIGRDAIHIGAGGWIFGLWALLLTQGVLRRQAIDIIIGLVVLIYFSGMATGLLPGQQYISTESHIAGAIAGIFYGWCSYKKAKNSSTTERSNK